MRDKISERRIELLHPKVRTIFKTFIEEAENELGITLRIVQGLRTFDEQAAIYAQGRTKPGKIVTNAKPGSSYHNYGLAIDVAPLSEDGKSINWDYNFKLLCPFAKNHGLRWGGDWDGDGKTKADGDKDEHLVDYPHFELTFGVNWKQMLEKYNKKDFIKDTKYINL